MTSQDNVEFTEHVVQGRVEGEFAGLLVTSQDNVEFTEHVVQGRV